MNDLGNKKVAAAIRRLEILNKALDFDPFVPGSRGTERQEEILRDAETRFKWIVAGNQCLAKGTLVMTPKGVVPIEKISVGDTVYDEYGKEIKVLEVFSNGIKEVNVLSNRNLEFLRCTDSHVFLTKNSSARKYKEEELKVSEFKRDTQIKRVIVDCPLGDKVVKDAYAIGAMLGDGCKDKSKSSMYISGADECIINKVSSVMNTSYVKCGGNNYTWRIKSYDISHKEWIQGKYAHEKYIDLDEVRTWNRESVLELVAGIIDTDGSVQVDTFSNLVIVCGMQSKSVIEFLQWAFLTLWQTVVSIKIDDRDKYVNGAIHQIKSSSNAYTKRILKELTNYLTCERKKWIPSYEHLEAKRSNENWVALKKSTEVCLEETYDIHVDSLTNLYLLANGLVTHNSGKSAIMGRLVSWFIEETHPYWTRPEEWKGQPLKALVVGNNVRHYETELWEAKIKPFLTPGTYREKRNGSMLSHIEFTNGNRILFFSHHGISQARDKLQGFVANFVFLDEMPSTVEIIEELHRRVQAKNGYFIATFTPKNKNDKIRKMVDTPTSISKKYQLNMLDNPIYKGREKEILEQIQTLSEAQQRTILYGDWSIGDFAVYNFNVKYNVRQVPVNYSYNWRHVLGFDPAAAGLAGLTVWAEDPVTNIWYCVLAKYIKGSAPSDLILEVEKEVAKYNIVKRIGDSHEVWFFSEARKNNIKYVGVVKQNRKVELIKNLQQGLTDGKIFVTPECEDLIDEFLSCEWSDNELRIINSSKYHLLDSAQYAYDLFPKPCQPADVKYTGNFAIDYQLEIRDKFKKEKIKKRNLKIKRRRYR